MPEEDSDWLPKNTVTSHEKDSEEYVSELAMVSLKAYAFGDRFVVLGFRSDLATQLEICLPGLVKKDYMAKFIAVVQYAFENLRQDSIVLQCLIEALCDHWSHAKNPGFVQLALQKLPPAMLGRTLGRFSEMILASLELSAAKKKEIEAMPMLRNNSRQDRQSAIRRALTTASLTVMNRCYDEHLTVEEKEICAEYYKHMRYDEKDDHGYFE